MQINHLIRDGRKVKSTLQAIGNNLVTTTGCKIYFPKHYVASKLGEIEANIRVLGIFAIVVDNTHYAVNNVNAKLTLTPDSINHVNIDDSPYLELTFHPNSIVILGLELVRVGPFLFNIYDEIIAKGKTPWYLNYADLGSIFDTAQHHAGVNLKVQRSILEMMSASRARNPKDRALYYRHMLKSQSDYVKTKPDVIPLRSVSYGSTNTTSRLLGAYLGEGISSTLVNQSTRQEEVERLLVT